MIFSNENNRAKLILNTAHHGWVTKKSFHSRLSKIALNGILPFCFLPFYLNEKHQICILCQKTFIKRTVLKYCVKSHLKIFLIKVCGNPHTRRKESLLPQKLYKSTLSNFYLCHLQSILFWEASGISNIAPSGNEDFTAIKCSILLPDN